MSDTENISVMICESSTFTSLNTCIAAFGVLLAESFSTQAELGELVDQIFIDLIAVHLI